METRKTRVNRFSETKTRGVTTIILAVFISDGACNEDEILPQQQEEQDNLPVPELLYTIVGTNQTTFYDDFDVISTPAVGEPFLPTGCLLFL
ncbi:hypothetical protein [Maribellus maritimus]|uniref:hypothetical protein n=1 Tax=Maribellus maritimus TaxID=2870838 RepID=UPI001EEA1A0A|nr:hypothetical protein [Maribellus maritimus]MCG6186018.1 hypothetical protein [Maribellus maritimus]